MSSLIDSIIDHVLSFVTKTGGVSDECSHCGMCGFYYDIFTWSSSCWTLTMIRIPNQKFPKKKHRRKDFCCKPDVDKLFQWISLAQSKWKLCNQCPIIKDHNNKLTKLQDKFQQITPQLIEHMIQGMFQSKYKISTISDYGRWNFGSMVKYTKLIRIEAIAEVPFIKAFCQEYNAYKLLQIYMDRNYSIPKDIFYIIIEYIKEE